MNREKTIRRTEIILASASPRRRELLKQIGLDFQVLATDAEEKRTTDIPWKLVEDLSAQKAWACLEALQQEAGKSGEGRQQLIIGADTVVCLDGKILGKPADAGEAIEMLGKLQGSSHQVYTGVTLLYRGAREDSCEKTFHEVTTVQVYPMTEKEIVDYVSTGEPLDKAGAYGIQGLFAKFIRGMEGDYNNVVGLPTARLYQEAKEWL